ncbi:MAG: polysulfide reductase NrfD [Coriobacteriia bacterium]|nr:polysulfide reductase NrfD [Coriobacteriia bacterium]
MIVLQTTWNWLIVVYLFLGGLSAGAYCTAAILHLFAKGRFAATIKIGAWAATITLAVGLLALIADLENPLRAFLLWQSFSNLSSWMAIGAWLICVAFIVFLLTSLLLTEWSARLLGSVRFLERSRAAALKVLSVLGIALALGVALYTGILLQAAPGIPLWDSWLLPVLFTFSALDTGVAAVLIILLLFDKDSRRGQLGVSLERVTIVLILLEGAALAAFFLTLLQGGRSEVLAASIILEGQLSWAFWLLLVCVGLAIPLLIAVIQQFMKGRHNRVLPLSGAFALLIGGFTLRYVIVAAGIHAALTHPVAEQAMHGFYFFVT